MATDEVILQLTTQLVGAIAAGDWEAYAKFCDKESTIFEPETALQQIKGLPFHKYYFDLPAGEPSPPSNQTIASPEIRVVGDVAM
jgi:calcium/calmodulin-dependent protein kinase (CaM kinase) II